MAQQTPSASPASLSELSEQAALHVAGALPADEAAAFEADLVQDSSRAAELASLRAVGEALARSISPAEPPPSAKASLMARLDQMAQADGAKARRDRIWRDWDADAAASLYTLHAHEGSWDPTGVEGVEVRRLFVDRANNRMTAMFRMQPGASYPEHDHAGIEECYVLQGDLHVGDDLVMRAGDYQRAGGGSEHAAQWTEGGCLLLVSCALNDRWK